MNIFMALICIVQLGEGRLSESTLMCCCFLLPVLGDKEREYFVLDGGSQIWV